MSEHANYLRSAADHLERVEAALRASTELLREETIDPDYAPEHMLRIKGQLAANEAALMGGAE